jgi:hypothetical protein
VPLLTLNGVIRPAGDWQGALTAENLDALAAGGPVIFPFVEGRRAAILPPDYGQASVMRTWSWIGGLFGLLAVLAAAARIRATGQPGTARLDTPTAEEPAASARPEPVVIVTSADTSDLPEVPRRRTPTRAILLGLALAFIAAASILALPGLSARFGVESATAPAAAVGSWATDRWRAAMSGDLRAIVVLMLGTGAVAALAVKVAIDTLRRPSGAL